jgi:hypothetical protein
MNTAGATSTLTSLDWATTAGFAVGIFRMAGHAPVSLGLVGFEHGYAEAGTRLT